MLLCCQPVSGLAWFHHGEPWGWLVTDVAFICYHSLQRLMNWLCGCCQCVCALGEGVPDTGGNPSYGIRPGAAIVAVLQGALGAGGPGAALTHILLSHPWRHSSTFPYRDLWLAPIKWPWLKCSYSTGKLPDWTKPLTMTAAKGQKRKVTFIQCFNLLYLTPPDPLLYPQLWTVWIRVKD